MATIPEALAIAIQHQQAGRLEAAEQIYRQILQVDPNQPDALHLLGVIAYTVGKLEIAIEYMARAVQLKPDFATAHNNLGNALKDQGKPDEAVACYQRALALKPNYAEAHSNLGGALSDQGKPKEAVACYQRALALKPNYAEAHNNLGGALSDQGKLEEAVSCYRRALALKPDLAKAHSNLGAALSAQGKLEEAVACYQRALALKPNYAEAHSNLGAALSDQGKLEEAVSCYRRALALKPDLAKAHNNLGAALMDQGKLDEAVACYQRALALKPNYAEAYSNLGAALSDQGKLEEAVACYQQAVALKPDYAEVHYNLGNALKDQGKLEEAVACYQQAISLKPDYGEADNNLGAALSAQGKLEEAVAWYQRALALKPDYAEAHYNLGKALKDQGKLDEAVVCYQQALALKPNYAEAHNNLGNALKDQGKLDGAIACYRKALHLKHDYHAAHSNIVHTMNFCADQDAHAIYEELQHWSRQHAEPLARLVRPHDNDPAPERRVRIGYVSPDFRDHCQTFFTVPLFSSHDHANFEICCYADVRAPDEATRRLRTYADHWRNIAGLSDQQVAELIRQDKIDMLVDLTMHMAQSRLLVFARKPAPVQVCWLAYPGTTGLKTMDYRLTDPYLDPPGQDVSYYSEESIRLPETFWCYDPLTEEPGVGPLPALANGYVTFGCLNNFCKVNDKVLTLWASVLRAVPRSRLLLLAREGAHRRTTLDFLEHQGITADRVEFVPFLPRKHYLAMYHRIDIGVETLPANGHTTSLDSLWMGVPVLTLAGHTVVGRAGVSQLSNLGLREWIADTPEKWTNMVVELANDLPRLGGLRATLRKRMRSSPLMDAPRFARNIEAAYRDMWRRWCAGR